MSERRPGRGVLREHALRLFREQGYQRTTVEQIAAAAEVSPSTFFRQFRMKEDLVPAGRHGHADGRGVRAPTSRARPVAAVRGAIRETLESYNEADLEVIRQTTTLTMTVPEVRSRAMDEFVHHRAISEALAKRSGRPADDLAVRTVAGVIIGVIMSITMPWEGWSVARSGRPSRTCSSASTRPSCWRPGSRSSRRGSVGSVALQRRVSGAAGRWPTVDGPAARGGARAVRYGGGEPRRQRPAPLVAAKPARASATPRRSWNSAEAGDDRRRGSAQRGHYPALPSPGHALAATFAISRSRSRSRSTS